MEKNPANQLIWYVFHYYRVSYIPGGAGLLPSTVPPFYKRRNLYNKQTNPPPPDIVPDAMTPMSRMEPNKMAWQGRLVQGRIFCSTTGGHNCRGFCTSAPGTKNCLLWVQYFHTPTTKKTEIAIEK